MCFRFIKYNEVAPMQRCGWVIAGRDLVRLVFQGGVIVLSVLLIVLDEGYLVLGYHHLISYRNRIKSNTASS